MKDTYLQYGIVARECENVMRLLEKDKLKKALTRIPVVLGGLRRCYEQVRVIASPSVKDPSVTARSAEVVMPVVKESVNLLEKLLGAIPKENIALLDAMHRIEKMMSFFAVEALKFAPKPKSSAEQEIECLGSLNADAKPTISNDFLVSCRHNLYQAVTADFSHFTCAQLREIAKAHGSVYLDLHIVQSVLKTNFQGLLAERVRLVVDLLWRDVPHYGHLASEKQYPVHMRETPLDITRSKCSMVKSLDEFLKNTEDAINLIKCDLVRSCIEDKLRSTSSHKPWQLGWAGSRHRIEFAGKIYYVPKGICDLYASVKPTQGPVDWARVTKVTEQVQAKQNSVGSFFSSLFGCSRGKETQRFYDELHHRVREPSLTRAFYTPGGRTL